MLQLEFKDSVTSQQKAWWNEALSRMTFLKDAKTVKFNADVATVDEPPCEGHGEYMCTQVRYYLDGSTPDAHFYIKTGADDPTQSFNSGVASDIKSFFMESVIHEYGHALTFGYLATDDAKKADLCHMFRYKKTGRVGTLEDWNPEGEWADKIQEGVAEFFKDVYMPAQFRYFENRSNWWMNKGDFPAFIDMIYDFLCPPPDTPV